MAIQALLVDACVLRDYLAEFATRYIYTSASQRSLGSLRKYVAEHSELLDLCRSNYAQRQREVDG